MEKSVSIHWNKWDMCISINFVDKITVERKIFKLKSDTIIS